MISRVIVLVMDGFGVGELPDAGRYGDVGSHTLNHIAQAVGGLTLPNLERLGLEQLGNLRGTGDGDRDAMSRVVGAFGKMAEASAGKDTTTGHWEMMGLVTERPFPTYPKGFPANLIRAFEAAIGRESLGNVVASGTEILKTLGDEHVRTGYPIVYTSADSVFQIAAHEEVVPLDRLYDMCLKARAILTGEHAVGRVIARPFVGEGADGFTRTYHRRDFAVPPFGETALDRLKAAGLHVVGLGKIEDIFSGRGLTEAIHTEGNRHGMRETIRCVEGPGSGLIFTNLVDFDMLYGHRNDVVGYAKALSEFDRQLGELLPRMRESDLLMLTSDHGNDPVMPSTDHSREYVPLLAWGPWMTGPVDLGVRATFADLGQTILDAFHLDPMPRGTSCLSSLRGRGGTQLQVPVRPGPGRYA